MDYSQKVIVIALDGATWSLLKKLIIENKTPNLRKIVEKGVYGVLKSTIPPITGPAWVSFATGKNPGKHGCYDFSIPVKRLDELHTISSKDIKTHTFYELLEQYGKNNILVNLPASTPPRIKGIVIADLLSFSKQLWFPKELIHEIPELENYRLSPKGEIMLNREVKKLVKDIVELESVRFNIAYKLFTKKKWDFFFLLFSGTDWIQHVSYYQLINNGEHAGLTIFMEIDKYIGMVLNALQKENYSLFIMSDHGFNSYKGTFHVNDWLEAKRFLMREEKSETSTEYVHQVEKEMCKAKELGIQIQIPSFILKIAEYFPFTHYVYLKLKKIFKFNIKKPNLFINLKKTYAYSTITGASNFSGIYINSYPPFVNGIIKSREDYEKVRKEIINKLASLPFITWARKKEEVYWGPYLLSAPDIILKSSKYVIDKSWNYPSRALRNEHHIDGIFIAYGPNFKRGAVLQNASILDIAPTILHIFDVPIPKDMDGKVLKEIFKENSILAKKDINYQETDYERKRIKKRIEKLRKRQKI